MAYTMLSISNLALPPSKNRFFLEKTRKTLTYLYFIKFDFRLVVSSLNCNAVLEFHGFSRKDLGWHLQAKAFALAAF